MFKQIFENLGLSEISEKVFYELLKNGPTSAKVLANRMNIPRPSIYDHIRRLQSRGLVTEKNVDNKKVFLIEDIDNIDESLGLHIQSLQEERSKFKSILKDSASKLGFIEPTIKFYSGKDGVKNVLNHIMTNRNIETELFWPMGDMLKVLGPEYLEDLNRRRIERNIFLRAIWPTNNRIDTKKYPYLSGDEEHLRELRFAPKGMTWNMGYWMYENRVAFLSSEKEGFGFVIHSKEFAQMMKLQFEQMWKVSKPSHAK